MYQYRLIMSDQKRLCDGSKHCSESWCGYGATFLVHAMVKVWEIRLAIFAIATILAQCSMVFGQTCSNELYPALPFVAFQSTASKKSLSISFLCRTSGNFTVKLARLPLILNRILPWAFSSFFFKFSLFWNLSFSVDMIWNFEHSELCLCSSCIVLVIQKIENDGNILHIFVQIERL